MIYVIAISQISGNVRSVIRKTEVSRDLLGKNAEYFRIWEDWNTNRERSSSPLTSSARLGGVFLEKIEKNFLKMSRQIPRMPLGAIISKAPTQIGSKIEQ